MVGIGWALFWLAIAAFCAWATVFPRTAFRIVEAWKYSDPETAA